MRRLGRARSATLALALAAVVASGSSAWAQDAPAPAPAPAPAAGAPTLYNPPPDAPTLAAYRTALGARHLTDSRGFGIDAVRERLAEAETLRGTGRQDEAIARLYELVDDPQFAPFQNDRRGSLGAVLPR